ncbi:MAG: F0F1 ATP synthase subunit gamma [Alphaproteobacteria bacterium]|nr:F0F1 ATP synthase subunit gamma [Alphaproteobacteria bacterium]
MPSLKDLKNRIASVKSTRKITSAMKMVAASKLRRAQDQAESSRPYARFMSRMLATMVTSAEMGPDASPLLAGTGKQETILLVVMTSDRGLCGAFNGSIIREARRQIASLEKEGKTVKLICVGRKARDLLRREHGDKFVHTVESAAKKQIDLEDAQALADKLKELYAEGGFDVAYLLYNKFRSAISQIVTLQQIVPFAADQGDAANSNEPQADALACELFEPQQDVLLARLLDRNLMVQIFAALLESSAGEQGARMTAMDNATRNAGDMIDRLTLNYNRSRQAYITKELIEIISGAEAV